MAWHVGRGQPADYRRRWQNCTTLQNRLAHLTPYHLHIHQVLAADVRRLRYRTPAGAGYAAAHNLQLLDLMNQLTTEFRQRHRRAGQIRFFEKSCTGLLNFSSAILLSAAYTRRRPVVMACWTNTTSTDRVLVIGPEQQIMKANRMATSMRALCRHHARTPTG